MLVYFKVLIAAVTSIVGAWLVSYAQHQKTEADFRALNPDPPVAAAGIQPRPHRNGRARPMGTSLQHYNPR